jgi:hypothetical protein
MVTIRLKKTTDAVGGTVENFYDHWAIQSIRHEVRGTAGRPAPADRTGSSNQ